MLVHFQDLRDRLDCYSRRWDQYEEYRVSWEILNLSPVEKMRHDGNAVYLKKLIITEALELECDVMAFGYAIEHYYYDLFDAIASSDNPFKSPDDTSTNAAGRNLRRIIADDRHAYTTGTTSRFLYFLQPEIGKHIKNSLGSGGCLAFRDGRNPIEYELIVEPGSYNDPSAFANKIESLSRESGLYDELNSQRVALKRRIEVLVRKLMRRAEEPMPFWETFVGSSMDVLRP